MPCNFVYKIIISDRSGPYTCDTAVRRVAPNVFKNYIAFMFRAKESKQWTA